MEQQVSMSVKSLTDDIARFAQEKAIVVAENEALRTENEKLRNLVAAYEDKEKLERPE